MLIFVKNIKATALTDNRIEEIMYNTRFLSDGLEIYWRSLNHRSDYDFRSNELFDTIHRYGGITHSTFICKTV